MEENKNDGQPGTAKKKHFDRSMFTPKEENMGDPNDVLERRKRTGVNPSLKADVQKEHPDRVIYDRNKIARYMASKANGLTIDDANVLVGLFTESLIDIIFEERGIVYLSKFCNLYLKEFTRIGRDFKNNCKYPSWQKSYRVVFETHKCVKGRARELAKTELNIGGENGTRE